MYWMSMLDLFASPYHWQVFYCERKQVKKSEILGSHGGEYEENVTPCSLVTYQTTLFHITEDNTLQINS